MRGFDSALLERLATVEEVEIGMQRPRVVIWIVVVGERVYVRSVRGERGRWYRALRARREGVLRVGRARLPVRAVPVRAPSTIAAVSLAFLQKYRESPYARSMVAPATLGTTLRLEPLSGRRSR